MLQNPYMVSTPDTDNLNPTIIFVYNAESGLLNAVVDYAHKIVSPKTYACNLCAVTFSNTGMKGEWKAFISTLGIPVEFLHRDEFLNKYPVKDAQFPAAFLKNGGVSLFITHTEINACETLEDLMDLVTKKVEKIR